MNDSQFIEHTSCSSCGSSDASGVYSDGHTFCFSCGVHGNGSPVGVGEFSPSPLAPTGQPQALPKRRITEATCQKFGYTVSQFKGKTVQIANYRSNGKVIGQKIRGANKDFTITGKLCLFGQHLFKDGGKQLVITEGEIDALSVFQAMGSKWPVVSLPNGAQGAAKAIRKEIDFVSSFERVILMFDMDDPGQSAAVDVADLLPSGKAHIAQLSLKDPSEMLQQGKSRELVDSIWQAKPYRPDGIIAASDLWDKLVEVDATQSVPYPYKGLNEKTRGIRKGELVTFSAGSGVGKTSVVREIAFDLLKKGQRVGMMMLEENTKRTLQGMLGLELNKPLHLDPDAASKDEMRQAFNEVTPNLFLYDHFGSIEADNLINRIRYLATGAMCDFIVLDHISIAISGLADVDERRCIDQLMTRLRSLVEETGVGLMVISHLKRPEGRAHEEGGVTSLSQLRGSHAIAQLSDMVLGLERNQQDAEKANVTTIRVLKNRFSGETGEAATLLYNKETGRVVETEPESYGFTPEY